MEDVFAYAVKEVAIACPQCGRSLSWKPYVRTQSTKAPFFCEQAGRKFHSYGDLERWAKDNGKTILPAKEYERTQLGRKNNEPRVDGDNRIREKVHEVATRLRQGYKFHEETRQEYRKRYDYKD